MPESLNVLIVDEADETAQPVLQLLETGGFELSWRRVQDLGQLQSALAEERWDLVLAAFRPPAFDPLTTLQLREARNLCRRRSAEARFEALFDNAMEGLFQTTSAGRFHIVNPATARILGFDDPEQLKREISDIGRQVFVEPADRTALLDLLREHGVIRDFETRFKRRDGAVIWVTITARAIRDDKGDIALIEGMMDDVTVRKQALEELAALNRELERQVQERTRGLEAKAQELTAANHRLTELDEMKSALISTISHELRTPLTSVLGFAKLISKDFDARFLPLVGEDPKLRKKGRQISSNLGIIVQEGERLSRLINDFLDLAKIEAGKLEWRDAPLDMADIVKRAGQAVSGQFNYKPGVELRVEATPDLPVVVADPDRILQVLINLLSNAAKHTQSGRVILSATSPRPGVVRVEVSDTGEGIPQSELGKIFDKFYQVRRQDSLTKPTGSGLGLTICKQIVEYYKGAIWAESEPGKGSAFFVELLASPDFQLPAEPLDAPSEPGRAPQERKPLVLIVDDDNAVRAYLSQFLQEQGYDTAVASDGPAALSKARILNPDVITMDLLMPEMDGDAVIALLRRDPQLRSIPILVITVMYDRKDMVGDAVVGKPIDEQVLLDVLHGLLSHRRPASPLLLLERREGSDPDLGPYFTLCTGDIRQCDDQQLWRMIDAGFQGTLILPAWAAKSIDLTRLPPQAGIQVLILPDPRDMVAAPPDDNDVDQEG